MAERIVSPGVFTRERDLSFLPQAIGEIGAAFIPYFGLSTRAKAMARFGKIKGRVNNTNRYVLGSANASLVQETAIGSATDAHNTNIKQSNILTKVKKNKNFLAG